MAGQNSKLSHFVNLCLKGPGTNNSKRADNKSDHDVHDVSVNYRQVHVCSAQLAYSEEGLITDNRQYSLISCLSMTSL